MQIKSLGFQTNLIFARFNGSIVDKGHYTVIQTPSNPGYHWGNYLIFDRAPKKGDLRNWKRIFDQEFPYYKEPQHYVFAWEESDLGRGELEEFLDAGYDTDEAVVLTAAHLNPPPHPNSLLQVRKVLSDLEWQAVTDLQILTGDQKFKNDYYVDFKKRQMAQYRKMAEAGKGHWFGAYLGDRLVGDLGVFFENDVARYQSVGTHPDFRRRGICGSLVYQAGEIALKEWGVHHLVMEADPHYYAARIYESVGFQRGEVSYALSWWRGKP